MCWLSPKKKDKTELVIKNTKQVLPIYRSICYSASMPKKIVNEDAHLHFQTNRGLFVFAVADGLGSYSAAAEASKLTIEYVKQHADIIKPDSKFLIRFFQDINNHLFKSANGDEYKNCEKENLLGTTLILGIEEADKITFAYLGNGAIIHVRGTINEFKDKDDPWFAINLLNPHTVPQRGKDCLCKFLTNDSDYHGQPSIISIEKDNTEGDAFIICTDGISSQDHYLLLNLESDDFVGLARTYIEDVLLDLYNILKNFKYTTYPNLEILIDEFLKKNKEKFNDDATLSILLTNNFINQNSI